MPTRVASTSTLKIRLTALSELTGVKSIEVFVGELENGKVPAKAKLKTATRDPESSTWFAELKIPGKAGDVSVTAVATNGAGLKTIEQIVIHAVLPADLDKGTIAGQIFEGVVRQPSLTVLLVDGDGKVVAKTKSRFDGRFAFEEVASGNYVLTAAKPASGRFAKTNVKVTAGNKVFVDLALGL